MPNSIKPIQRLTISKLSSPVTDFLRITALVLSALLTFLSLYLVREFGFEPVLLEFFLFLVPAIIFFLRYGLNRNKHYKAEFLELFCDKIIGCLKDPISYTENLSESILEPAYIEISTPFEKLSSIKVDRNAVYFNYKNGNKRTIPLSTNFSYTQRQDFKAFFTLASQTLKQYKTDIEGPNKPLT